jgi:hypothetical protein
VAAKLFHKTLFRHRTINWHNRIERKKPLERHMHRWKDNIKMGHKEIEYVWIHTDKNGTQCRTFVNTVMKGGIGGDCVDCKAAEGSHSVPRNLLYQIPNSLSS